MKSTNRVTLPGYGAMRTGVLGARRNPRRGKLQKMGRSHGCGSTKNLQSLLLEAHSLSPRTALLVLFPKDSVSKPGIWTQSRCTYRDPRTEAQPEAASGWESVSREGHRQQGERREGVLGSLCKERGQVR